MYDNRSHYGLNKSDPDAIVYTDAEGHIIRLTRADFETDAEFLKWKMWSDENYYSEEKANHLEDNHTTPLTEADGAADGPELVFEQRIELRAREQYTAETVTRVRGSLTEKQFRRLWLYSVEGMTEESIARRERKTQQGISKSIMEARKKILKFFSKTPF
ncbi:MAG: hypothetical protein IKM73_13695 [Acidaminococcaceae bacterium]|nr:hypothetical protein [Acidaminococcaceae bacterium]